MQDSISKVRVLKFTGQLIGYLVPIFSLVLLANFQPETCLSLTLRSQSSSSKQLDGIASCHLRELELCAVGILSIFQNPNGLPISGQEMRRQCEYFNESSQCFSDYADRCLTKMQLPVVQLFTNDLGRLGQEFCESSSELRKNYTKHVGCLKEVQRKYQRPCLVDLQVGFEAIHKVNMSLRMSTSCCNINRLKECVFVRIEEDCGSSAMEMIGLMIERLTGSFMSVVCRDFDPFGETCSSLLPKVNTKPFNGRNVSALSRVISGFTNVPAQR